MYVEANGARFWVVEKGEGSAVLFFHFGLGDWRVFEPQLDALADDFRCIAYDRRFYGRTEAPDEPHAPVDDAVALLDALDVERVALVGLSGGGGLALNVTYAHPERVSALVHIAAPVTGLLLVIHRVSLLGKRLRAGRPHPGIGGSIVVRIPLAAFAEATTTSAQATTNAACCRNRPSAHCIRRLRPRRTPAGGACRRCASCRQRTRFSSSPLDDAGWRPVAASPFGRVELAAARDGFPASPRSSPNP